MQNGLRVDVANAFNDLPEENFSQWLLALLTLAYKVKEVTTCTELHNKHDMALGLKCFVELDN